MQIPGRPGVQLTYCSNIHPAESWPQTRDSVLEHFAAVRLRVAPDQRFGVGLRLSAVALAQLHADPGELDRFAARLDEAGLHVFTINGFPYGPFHGAPVKQQVYRPDWRTAERLEYTESLARTLARLLAPGMNGSISTVPGGFRPDSQDEGARAQIADNLLRCAASLWRVAATEGKRITLALEPEPHCMLETTDEAIEWFESTLLGAAAITRMTALTGLARGPAEAALREHLGLCIDTCHAAVEFEHPTAGIERLRAAGVRLAKLQVTAGLELDPPSPAAIEALAAFADPVYLHQVVAELDDPARTLVRFVDLPEAIAAFHRGELRARRWRVHFHVPVFQCELPPFRGTQAFLPPVLAAALDVGGCTQLELETYTWDVLPPQFRAQPVDDAIARELRWVLAQLADPEESSP
jgi:hypothetical protein